MFTVRAPFLILSLFPSLQMVLTVLIPSSWASVPSAGRFPDYLFFNVMLEVVRFLPVQLFSFIPSFPSNGPHRFDLPFLVLRPVRWPFPGLIVPQRRVGGCMFSVGAHFLLPSFPPSLQMVLTVLTPPLLFLFVAMGRKGGGGYRRPYS